MVDLQKLDSIIDDLEESTAHFVKISSIAQQVQQTAAIADESAAKLSKVIDDVLALNTASSDMQDAIRSTYQDLEEHFKTVQLQNAQFSSQVNTLLLEIKNEGHALNKQLANALESKIDVMKSDIILENRSKTMETQEQIAAYHRDISDTLISTKIEIINASAKQSQENQEAIIVELKQAIEQSETQFGFLKGISIVSAGMLLVTIILLLI